MGVSIRQLTDFLLSIHVNLEMACEKRPDGENWWDAPASPESVLAAYPMLMPRTGPGRSIDPLPQNGDVDPAELVHLLQHVSISIDPDLQTLLKSRAVPHRH